MTIQVFIDLENTIIKDWHNPVLMNHEFLHQFFDNMRREFSTNEISIFSFAIDDKKDVDRFNAVMRTAIENTFDVKVVNVITVEQVREASLNVNQMSMDLWEYKSVWGKTRAFKDFIDAFGEGNHFVLVDDVVKTSFEAIMDDEGEVKRLIQFIKPIESGKLKDSHRHPIQFTEVFTK